MEAFVKKTITALTFLSTAVLMSVNPAGVYAATATSSEEFALAGIGSKSLQRIQTLENKVNSKWESIQKSLSKEATKLKLKTSVDLDLELGGVTAGTYYKYEVEPSLRDGEQVRRDVWAVELSNDHILSAGTHVRVTFSRNFSGEGAKGRAMRAMPYFFGKVPKNSNEIKEKLKTGESVRIEIFGRAGLLKSDEAFSGSVTQKLNAGYGREALFLVDLYKHSETSVRARILGLNNKGVANLGASVTTLPPTLDVLPRKLREIFSIGAGVELKKTKAYKHEYPITSLMIDFLYNFSTKDQIPKTVDTSRVAEGAIDQILGDLRNMGFAPLFNPRKDTKLLAESLLAHAKLSEQQWKEDRQALAEGKITQKEVRTKTLFKGSIELDSYTMKLKGNASAFIAKEFESGGHHSFITSMDYNDRPNYYLMDNSYTQSKTKSKIILGKNDKRALRDIDLLVLSNKNGDALKIADLIVKNDIEDNTMDAKQLEGIKKTISRSLPSTVATENEIDQFFPSKDESNVSLTYQYNFGELAFKSVAQKNSNELSKKLYTFLDTHPARSSMTLPDYYPATGGISYAEYIDQLGYELNDMLTTKGNDKRMKIFNRIKTNPIAQKFILGEFFASLIPAEIAKSAMGLKLTYSSNETTTKVKRTGEYEISPIYQEVAFIRSILNDRSYDIRMETIVDAHGNEVIKPTTLNGFQK